MKTTLKQAKAGLLAALSASLLVGCQLPGNLSFQKDKEVSVAGGDINDPASVFNRTYDPKSKEEDNLDGQIKGNGESYYAKSQTDAQLEGRSSVADSFANRGGVHHSSWWSSAASRSVLNNNGKTVKMGLDEIYKRALENSNQIKVFASLPLIRETAIDEAEAAFDAELFAESRYDRTDEPTGSTLDTGNVDDFLKEDSWTFEGGVRKRFQTGAQIALSQELSEVSSNSEFFVPGEQGKARLKLSVLQPLLRGAGVKYNRTMMQIARLDAETGYDEFVRQLETHLMEVNRSYWSLYLARTAYLEKQRLVADTQSVVSEISKRGKLDATASQRSRAESALATRKADLIRSELAIKNSESRLRALVNDPYFHEAGVGEIVPGDLPVHSPVNPDFSKAVAQALNFRPEIKQAENHLRAANLREMQAKNEKLPTLNAVGEIGMSALRGDGNYEGAFGDEFDDNAPSWGLGLIGSVPLGRKASKARHLRTELEVRQKKDQLRSAMDTVLLEVQIAHREVTTAYPDMKAKQEAADAADEELAVLHKRRGVDGEGGEALYLEKLLDAQERRTHSREEFLKSMVVYNASLTNFDRAKGTLLQHEQVGIQRTRDQEELPLIELTKQAAIASAKQSYAYTK